MEIAHALDSSGIDFPAHRSCGSIFIADSSLFDSLGLLQTLLGKCAGFLRVLCYVLIELSQKDLATTSLAFWT